MHSGVNGAKYDCQSKLCFFEIVLVHNKSTSLPKNILYSIIKLQLFTINKIHFIGKLYTKDN